MAFLKDKSPQTSGEAEKIVEELAGLEEQVRSNILVPIIQCCKVQKVFEEVSTLPRKQQERIVETVSALVEQYKRRAWTTDTDSGRREQEIHHDDELSRRD